MDPGPILFTEIQSTAILVLLFSANNHLPHNTVNPLLQQAGEIDNLTVSLGQSTLVVLCRFHVGAGIPGVAPHYTPPPSTFNVLLGSYWFDKPWFLTEGNLPLCASHLPLGVPNERVSYTPSSSFSGAVAGEIKTRCKGSLHFSISLLCFCLALFYLLLCLLH